MAEDTVSLTLRITPDLAKRVRQQAKNEGLTVNAFLIGVLNMGGLLYSAREWKQQMREESQFKFTMPEKKPEASDMSLEERVKKLEANVSVLLANALNARVAGE